MTISTVQVIQTPDGRLDRRNSALYLGVSEKTLAHWACYGKGPKFIKRGRVWYYRADLDAWLGTTAVSSTAAARLKVVG